MTNLDSIDLSINISYPLLLLFIILGTLYTYYIYKYTIPSTTKLLKSILIILRVTAISLILLLIFEPTLLLKYNNVIEPTNLFFVDNSHSIVNRDSVNKAELIDDFLISASNNMDGKSQFFSFGSSIDTILNPNESGLKFNADRTNFEQIGKFISNSKLNVSSATIVSDGIVNDGSGSSSYFEHLGIPIYTIAIGDTVVQTDVAIKKVMYNDLIYQNTPTEIKTVLINKNLADKNVTLFLYEDSKLIDQKEIKLSPTGINNISFTYTPKTNGEKSLLLSLSKLTNEETFENNRFPFVLNVLNDKIKLLLVAGAPSYDLTIIKQILSENKNVRVREVVQITKTKFTQEKNYKTLIDSSDIILMIDFPAQHSPPNLIAEITNAIMNKKKSYLFVLSQSVDQNKLNSFIKLPFRIQKYSDKFREIEPIINSLTDPLISSNASNITLWNNLPPVLQTESDISVMQGSNVLVKTKFKNIEMDIPLIFTNSTTGIRSIIINGFGIWRWKLQSEINSEYLLNSFINNSIKWLHSNSQKQRIFVAPVKKVFTQNDDIEFRASIYDETLNPRNDANITITASSNNNDYDFELTNIGNGIYEGKLDLRISGNYKYKSKIVIENKLFWGQNGKFMISDINIENKNYVFNKNYLKLISNNTNGKSFDINDYQKLFAELNSNYNSRTSIESISTKNDVWNNEWIMALIVFLFSIEWFLRKQRGLL